MLRLIKKLIRFLALRGPVRRWWSLRQCRKVEEAYLRELCRERDLETTPPPAPPPPQRTLPARPVRNVLFIGDCMWEQNELFPELRKFCNLQALDLNPALKVAAQLLPSETVARSIESFVETSKEFEPDVILFYARPSLLSEAAFDLLRRRWKCPLLGMNLDDRVQFFPYGVLASGEDNYARWVNRFDLNLTNAFSSMSWYGRRGAAVRYFPQGFHLEEPYQAPPQQADYDFQFSFLGSWKADRGVIIDRLAQAGVKISLFGKGWPNAQWVESASRVYRRSQINLGIGFAQPSAGITTTKGRDFECPGVGACYLTTYNWELPMLFDIGKEILCYREIEELLEVHGYYVKRPEECLRIAQAAHRRCLAEHTWEKRFRLLFRDLGFTA